MLKERQNEKNDIDTHCWTTSSFGWDDVVWLSLKRS